MDKRIYAPKLPCPRDQGYWYCYECKATHSEEQSNLDFPIKMRSYCEGVGNVESAGMVCGKTHLGYIWCKECKEEKRVENHHIGEYEVLGMIMTQRETDFICKEDREEQSLDQNGN